MIEQKKAGQVKRLWRLAALLLTLCMLAAGCAAQPAETSSSGALPAQSLPVNTPEPPAGDSEPADTSGPIPDPFDPFVPDTLPEGPWLPVTGTDLPRLAGSWHHYIDPAGYEGRKLFYEFSFDAETGQMLLNYREWPNSTMLSFTGGCEGPDADGVMTARVGLALLEAMDALLGGRIEDLPKADISYRLQRVEGDADILIITPLSFSNAPQLDLPAYREFVSDVEDDLGVPALFHRA